MCFLCLTGILRLDGIWIKDGIETLFYVTSVFVVFSEIKRALLFIIMILLCELALFGNIVLHTERKEQVLCIIVVELLLFSTGICDKQSLEE